MNKRLAELVDEIRLVVAKMETEHLCDDFRVCTEYGCIQNSLSKIKEIADEKDSPDKFVAGNWLFPCQVRPM